MENLIKQLKEARSNFEEDVILACEETKEIAKQISQAIGDISIDEAKSALVKIFEDNLKATRYRATFQGKPK